MGEDYCDLGLGLAIGGCEFKPVFNHDVGKEIRDREVEVTSRRERVEDNVVKKPKAEEGSVVKDFSDSTAGDDVSGSGVGTRKKLRLTKEQSSLLEDSFHTHQILSSKQKNELARQLNLKPRQVEVWFQNRRARIKLKQTEVDYELLKRRCDKLTCENERLKRELMELRLVKARAINNNYNNFQACNKIINICPKCEKIDHS